MKDKPHSFEPFNISTLDDLRAQAAALDLSLPLSEKVEPLKQPLSIGKSSAPNRLCVQPMEGCDADTGGAPGELTFRRYRRYAEGGFGLIWIEATAAEGCARSNPNQLWLNRRNVNAFAELVQEIRLSARQHWKHEVVIVLQLAHAGRYCSPEGDAAPMIASHEPALDLVQGIPADHTVVSDDYLDRLQETTVEAGCLALEAGFDGVDIKACHGDLIAELLCFATRTGRYGGSLENRSRFLLEVIGKLRTAHPELLVASRIAVSKDMAASFESVQLAQSLEQAGIQLLSVSTADNSSKEITPPLEKFIRLADSTRIIQQAVPELPVVAGGLSWFRHFLPNVAAGLLEGGSAKLIGIGRAALAYPSLASDLFQKGEMVADKCCIRCDACIQLLRDGGHAGCVVMDSDIYADEYLRCRHFALDNLQEEARRCRCCEPAPCRAGCPTRIDVPAFLKAFADGDMEKAYLILREANALPSMCSHLCPVGALCEGQCVAGTLDGKPIPIHDIQYAVCWHALCNGLTGLCIPDVDTEKTVAVVGGGPAGVSCAVTLLERGHHVVLFERDSRLGGTPELAIRSSRFEGSRNEMEAVLKPALYAARLTIRYGVELGRGIAFENLRNEHDAVFLAAGVWGEKSLGCADGVVAGVHFLTQVKAGAIKAVPERVVLLAGGDSAMDCAKVTLELGACELLIVYDGPLSEMHWHMEDAWFRSEGVHFLTLTRPICYLVDDDKKVTGLKIQRALTATEEILETTLVIEAMGLGLESSLAAALQGCSFTEAGLVKTVDEDTFACGLPGLFAGGGMINGGDSVVQCIAEGMRAGREIDDYLSEANTAGRLHSHGALLWKRE